MITYEVNKPLDAADVARVFDASTIRRPTGDLVRIAKMLAHGNLTISAWDGDKLVGISRALTDFAYCCYLSDLAVDKAYQRHGIGKEMITITRRELGDQVALILLSAPEAMDYYPKVGFEKIANGYIVKRTR
ncbi:GNAT family N-acetyltransferase [Reyranella sp. CPCC 100927]|uniref:GNAT family N-acetyltransferase n=1 Tax=Reyranella sp. CPCC 100927 TaxID=2599616 RepID=UPI0011B4793F|nr:GNAT family N-acetyltransferase [Reyranella sp. CPCC 100927]TWT13506.1 GNAT family N-acetyltransferase [Reyranella sp. CPCC 100927]